MASDSQTATATMSDKPVENKVKEEANLMEKEVVLLETVEVVKDKPVSDSNLTVEKEEQIDQTPVGEPEKESSADVEVAAAVKGDESIDKEKGENGEEKLTEQVELQESALVKEGVAEIIVQATVESVAEEDNKGKEEEKMVDVSELTDEAGGKQVEPVDVQLVRQVSAETVVLEVLEVESKPETVVVEVLKVEAQPEKTKEMVPEVEVVRTEDTPETTVPAKVELEGKLEDSIVETKDSGINSKNEQPSQSSSAFLPEGDAYPLPDVIEKTITEEKEVVEESSNDEKEKVSEEAKDVVTKLATEDEKKDTETEGTKQEESIMEKVGEVVETGTIVKESDETKQEQEVTTKEEVVQPKHSNSIMSKVKQSLVKAKKAIIGKSPSSKTITTEETKEEIKAK